MSEADAQRVRAVLAGDQAAFGDLYDRHAGWVRAVAYDATRDLALAQDLAQEVFLRAFGKLDDLRDPARFGPWLMGITRFAILEWRRNRNRDHCEPIDPAFDGSVSDPDAAAEEEASRVREAVQRLPERERLAVYVFYLQEQSVDDTRAVLNLSRAGLYRLLRRARHRLERIMNPQREGAR